MASWAMADVNEEFVKLFPEEAKSPPRGGRASAEFAGKLLNTAKSVAAQKELQVLLCEKAYEFGLKGSAGYQAAADAMKLLLEVAPDKKAPALGKLLKVTDFRFRGSRGSARRQLGEELVDVLVACGDERVGAKQPAEAREHYQRALRMRPDRARQATIQRKLKEIDKKRDLDREIAGLRKALERNEKNTAVREQLILAYVGEMDDPNEAAKFLAPDVREVLRTYVPKTVEKVEDLSEAMCRDLGEWYLATAENEKAVSKPGKGVLLGKAQACFERYLELHPTEDAERVNRKKLLAKVNEALERLLGAEAKEITLKLARGVTMKLVRIPAGSFVMGDAKQGDERPVRRVRISRPFYMGIYEVTDAQYDVVKGKNPGKTPSAPVVATWFSAAEFCRKLSGKAGRTVRLPTEAEWEYACRAGTRTKFFLGDDAGKLGDYAWFAGNAEGKRHPVGQKKPNPWGLYDMHGNMWEWCSDWRGPHAKAKTLDPHGPDSGTARVRRGGSWSDDSSHCSSSHRSGALPGVTYYWHGFRVVAEVAGVD